MASGKAGPSRRPPRAAIRRDALRHIGREARDLAQRGAGRGIEKSGARCDGEARTRSARARRVDEPADRRALRGANPFRFPVISRKPRIAPPCAGEKIRAGLDLELRRQEGETEAFGEGAVEDLLVHEAFRQQRLIGGNSVAARQTRALLQDDLRNAEVEQEGDFARKLGWARREGGGHAAQSLPQRGGEASGTQSRSVALTRLRKTFNALVIHTTLAMTEAALISDAPALIATIHSNNDLFKSEPHDSR